MVDVVGFGALNFDRFFKVERLAGGDSEVSILEQMGAPGGSAANTIYALGKLGVKCGFLGAVGKDDEGRRLLEDFKKLGIDISRISVLEEERTGFVMAFVDKNGERAMYISPGANMGITEENVDLNYLNGSRIVHMSSFVGEEQFDLQKRMAASLAGKVKMSISPGALYVNKGMEEIAPLLENVNIVFLNKRETESLTGEDYQTGADILLELGCETVVVTLGNEGSYVAFEGGPVAIPVKPIRAVDSTGAGDSYAAGFLFGVLHDRTPEECGRIGNIMASKCVQSMGARVSLPTLEELQSSGDFPK